MRSSPLFLIFMVLPFFEIAVLILVGQKLGILNTVLLVCLSTLAGMTILRKQGMGALVFFRQRHGSPVLQLDRLADGVLIALAGLLLVVPGFITDIAGLLLLLPPVRILVKKYWSRHFEVKAYASTTSSRHAGTYDLSPEDYRKAETTDTDPGGRRHLP